MNEHTEFNFYHRIKRTHPVMAWVILATIRLGSIMVAYLLLPVRWPEYSETIVGALLGFAVYDAWCFAREQMKKQALWKKVVLSIAFCLLAGLLAVLIMGYLRKIGFFNA